LTKKALLMYMDKAMMKRTVGLKLNLSSEQAGQLAALQATFASACNQIVPQAAQGKITNRIKLHHVVYYAIREAVPALGSQMACNAVHQVSKAYKTLLANRPNLRNKDWPHITFTTKNSVHFDKRAYSLRESYEENSVRCFGDTYICRRLERKRGRAGEQARRKDPGGLFFRIPKPKHPYCRHVDS